MVPNIRPVLLFRVCLLACICGVAFSQTAPTITVDKLVAKLYQYQTTMTRLIRVTCVTSPPGKTCRVSNRRIHPTNPCGACFTTLPNCQGKKENYCIWFVPDQGFFNPRIVSKYLITLEAEDADGLASQRLVDIRIITNSPPYFNYPNQSLTVVMSDSEGKKAGAILATVSATDDNNDQLTYTMTTVPDMKKNIVIDSFSGAIRTTKDLRELCLTSVTCLVKVQDPHSKAVGPFIVNLELKNGNHPPLITNLNAALYLREDEPIGKVLLELKIVDNRKYGNLQYTFSTIPPSMENYFYYKDGDDTLRVKQRLDFETQPHSIIMNVQATDGYCASELYTLDIRLVDVNEPPTLQPPPNIIETCEGWLDLVPIWNASDPDKGDSWTFTDVQPNKFGRFKIFEKSGSIASTVDYDVDASRHPASLELIVTLSDQQLLTATATVSVRVLDCNDNAPVFSKGSKDFKVTPCVPLGTVLGVVPKATDLDSDFRQNNVITYSGSSGLVTVDKDGNVVLAGVFKQGQHITFPAYASDKGEHPGPLTSRNPLWVSVYAEPCTEEELRTTIARPNTTTTTPTTITPPTTTGPNSAEGWSANEIWILTGAVLATALLLLALFMCVRYICPRCLKSCQRTHGGLNEANTRGFYRQEQHQQQQKNQQRHGGDDDGKESWSTDSVDAVLNNPDPSPEPTKQGPGFIFGWWKETFADTDYSNNPKRNAPPEPSKGPDKIFTHTFDPAD